MRLTPQRAALMGPRPCRAPGLQPTQPNRIIRPGSSPEPPGRSREEPCLDSPKPAPRKWWSVEARWTVCVCVCLFSYGLQHFSPPFLTDPGGWRRQADRKPRFFTGVFGKCDSLRGPLTAPSRPFSRGSLQALKGSCTQRQASTAGGSSSLACLRLHSPLLPQQRSGSLPRPLWLGFFRPGNSSTSRPALTGSHSVGYTRLL